MLKFVVILIYISKEIFDAVIDFLDRRYIKKELPENVRDVYNEEEYKNWVSYEKESNVLSTASDIVDIAVNLALFASNAYAWFFGLMGSMSVYIQYLLMILVINIISVIIDTPFDYYDTFVIEEKYGLNRSTKKTFWMDGIKSFLISTAVTYAAMIAVMILFERFGNLAIIWCCAGLIVVMLVISLIIVPLMRIYNKFEPLPDGELRDSLLELCVTGTVSGCEK